MRDPAPESAVLSAGADAVTVALSELRTLVYRLADEVAAFRRRARAAESRQRELERSLEALAPPEALGEAVPDGVEALSYEQLLARVTELDGANARLRQRLDEATERTRLLLERTRFLRQQQEHPEETS
ncbi:MAG: hypothetical protein ACYC2G_14360 [Gemmatimonadaceae bacterium]